MSSSVASPSISSPISTFRPRLWVQTSIAAFISLTIALYFWIDSRYPALLKKLHSGKGIQTKGALSFDALMPVTPAMSLMTRIGHTTVNWMWTNRIGMTFGICFGAAMLTLLSTLPRIRFKSAAGNTLLGIAGGVPLGVCANCVAPIGRSLLVAGASPNTVVAAMISSPTLNVVVLAMVFALFPLPIALVRVAVPLVLLTWVPVIVRKTAPAAWISHTVNTSLVDKNGWWQPPGFTLKRYLKNFAGPHCGDRSADGGRGVSGRFDCRGSSRQSHSHHGQPGWHCCRGIGRNLSAGTHGVRRCHRILAHDARSSNVIGDHTALHVGRIQYLPNADSGTHHLLAHRNGPVWLRDAARDRSGCGYGVNPARPLT